MTIRNRYGPPTLPWPVRLCACLLALAVLLAGCSAIEPRRESGRVGGPVLPDRVPAPELDALPPVAVLISRDTTPYRSVADALGEGAWTTYLVAGRDADTLRAELGRAGHRTAIAIGRQAADLAASTDLDFAYCQVFDAAPALEGRRGVAPLPDYGAQLDAWVRHRPNLSAVGLVTGPGLDLVGAALASAAGQRSLVLHRAVARSDRELLYVFQRMVPDIEGFVLYPDTRILSPAVIRELLAYAGKHDVQVLTYNRPLFELGAGLLMTADPQEIAAQVLVALTREGAGELPLSRVVVETRDPDLAAAP